MRKHTHPPSDPVPPFVPQHRSRHRQYPKLPDKLTNVVKSYDLFLFDFDGTLVDTDQIYYDSYKHAFEQKGVPFDLSFSDFSILLSSKTPTWEALQFRYKLDAQEADELRRVKTVYYWDSVKGGTVKLKPGVEKLLLALEQAGKACCVCTRSSEKEVGIIKSYLPVLRLIPEENWFTRHSYTFRKPNPECYLLAISRYIKSIGVSIDSCIEHHKNTGNGTDQANNVDNSNNVNSDTTKIVNNEEKSSTSSMAQEHAHDIEMGRIVSSLRVIGFEDTPTGVNTLLAAKIVQPVLVSTVEYPETDTYIAAGVVWCPGFDHLLPPSAHVTSGPQM